MKTKKCNRKSKETKSKRKQTKSKQTKCKQGGDIELSPRNVTSYINTNNTELDKNPELHEELNYEEPDKSNNTKPTGNQTIIFSYPNEPRKKTEYIYDGEGYYYNNADFLQNTELLKKMSDNKCYKPSFWKWFYCKRTKNKRNKIIQKIEREKIPHDKMMMLIKNHEDKYGDNSIQTFSGGKRKKGGNHRSYNTLTLGQEEEEESKAETTFQNEPLHYEERNNEYKKRKNEYENQKNRYEKKIEYLGDVIKNINDIYTECVVNKKTNAKSKLMNKEEDYLTSDLKDAELSREAEKSCQQYKIILREKVQEHNALQSEYNNFLRENKEYFDTKEVENNNLEADYNRCLSENSYKGLCKEDAEKLLEKLKETRTKKSSSVRKKIWNMYTCGKLSRKIKKVNKMKKTFFWSRRGGKKTRRNNKK